MIDHVKKGDALTITAEAYNAFADVANAYAGAGQGATLRAPRRAGIGPRVMCAVGAAVEAGQALRITGSERNLAAADIGDGPQIFGAALSWTAAQAAGDCLAIAAGSDPGGYVPAVVAGLALVALSVGDADHLFARPVAGTSAGEIESANAGPLRILAKSAATGADVWALCVVNQPGAPAPENPYVIDRTDTADDSKAWDVANDLPADWEDYDGVELITGTIRLDGTDLQQVKVRRQWPAAIAPIIPAVEGEDIETISDDFSCPE